MKPKESKPMPDISITIGGRAFLVSCQPGEDHFLRAAAQILDAEAQPLVAQLGRLPEVRMLLMAGLMLADRVAGQEDELRSLRARLAEADGRAAVGSAAVSTDGGGAVASAATERYAALAARLEAMAAAVEHRVAERAAG